MIKLIRALKRENFNGIWTPGRFWPSNETLRVEVLDEEPPLVDEPVFDGARQVGTRQVPDKTKISKKTLDDLISDGRVTIMDEGQADESEALAAQLEEASLKLAALTDENAGLKAQLEEASLKLAALTQVAGNDGAPASGEGGKGNGKKK